MSERPFPPDSVIDPIGSGTFLPAPEVEEWARATFIDAEGELVNPAHAHLQMASIGVLWTDESAVSQQRGIAGTAEIPTFRGKPWVKARQEAQVRAWFGRVPDFLLTFYAPYAASLDDGREGEARARVRHVPEGGGMNRHPRFDDSLTPRDPWLV